MSEQTYGHQGLSVHVSRTGNQARIAWRGTSDSRNPGSFLAPLIESWAETLANAEVTIDLTALEYMNSATVKPLIDLIKQLDGRSQAVLVVFRDADWQRTHRACLIALARTLHNTRIE